MSLAVFCVQNTKYKMYKTKQIFPPVLTVSTDVTQTVHFTFQSSQTENTRNIYFCAIKAFFFVSIFFFSCRPGPGPVHSETLRWEGEHIRLLNVFYLMAFLT